MQTAAQIIDVNYGFNVEGSNGKKGYKAFSIRYMSPKGPAELKKPVFGVEKVGGLVDKIKALKPQEKVVLHLEKQGQYWELQDITKEGETSVNATSAISGNFRPYSGNSDGQPRLTNNGRDFETSVERAARQRLIVAQSSFTAALSLLEKSNDNGFPRDHVYETADEIYNWVMAKGKEQS